MSEILNLAEKFKTQSKQQVTGIEQELQSATTQLNSFMTARLSESESIIKDGMDSLQLSNKQLQTMLSEQRTVINKALTTYLEQLQLPLSQDLQRLVDDTQTMIEDYATGITTLIQQREDRLVKIIKSEMKTWGIWASLIIFVVLILGIMLGVLITNKVTKPSYIYVKMPPSNQAPASMPVPKQYRP